jgi:hypothetical protein
MMHVTLPRPSKPVAVASYAEASRIVRVDIERRDWGASQWYGKGAGRIVRDGVQIAFVSYNGRVWEGIDDGKLGHKELGV